MTFYERRMLPFIIDLACAAEPVASRRRRIVPRAEGVVLEIGIGSGHNLPLYDAARVERLIACDPNPTHLEQVRKRAPVSTSPFEIELIQSGAEELKLDAESVDTVVFTFTLCTVADPTLALAIARKALKPEGQLLFCEHTLAPDPEVRRWQFRLEPAWKKLFGGCHLTRDTPELLGAAGFEVHLIDAGYASPAPRFAGYCQLGQARPRLAAPQRRAVVEG